MLFLSFHHDFRANNDTKRILSTSFQGINESLITCGVKPSNIFATYVPGAFELPLTARFLAASKRVDVIICVGCLIKGDTMHFEYIAGEKFFSGNTSSLKTPPNFLSFAPINFALDFSRRHRQRNHAGAFFDQLIFL